MASSEKQWTTGVVFNEKLATHYNAWNKDFTERPQRILKSIERCNELGLLQRCKRIPLRQATEDEILTCHTKEHLELLKSTKNMREEELKALSQKYDYIYFHEKSYENALLCVGGIVDLVDEIVSRKIKNGMAIVRPPGHHAMKEEFCGYCYFSNTAIAAQVALDKYHMKRILIFDWDVHHGQGSQFKFYDDPRVLFVSIHRYENGSEWPYLRESDYDYIGLGSGKGYTINVPLNQIGFGNDEYMSIFFNLLMPVCYEFDPELVLVSAGYDCAIGCPEGEMTVTPACFAHFVNLLMPLAAGKLALILEGGYNLKSLSESVAMSLRALMGDPTPNISPVTAPHPSVVESVLNCIKVLHPYWHCLRFQDLVDAKDIVAEKYLFPAILTSPPVKDVKFCTPETRPEFFPLIQECADMTAVEKLEYYNHILDDLVRKTCLKCAENRLSVLTDSKELSLARKLMSKNLWSQCLSLEGAVPDHTDTSSCLKASIESILTYKAQSSLCLVHATGVHQNGTANGAYPVCDSSLDLAIQYALSYDHIHRILVVELGKYGSHHQVCSAPNPSVLQISLTWPGVMGESSTQSTHDEICNECFTANNKPNHINIPFQEDTFINGDLISAMLQIVLPVSYEFCPDMVIVTWRNPLGPGDNSGSITPACMGHIIQLLQGLAQGRLLLLISCENSQSDTNYGAEFDDSKMVEECISIILGQSCSTIGKILPSESVVSAIKKLQDCLRSQWKVFQFRHALPKDHIL